jgi:hypothetical protein
MRAKHRHRALSLALFFGSLFVATPIAAQLDEHCTVSIFNRTARVRADGSWRIPNDLSATVSAMQPTEMTHG